MPLLPAKCPICDAILNIESEKDAAICPNCNNAFVVEKAINNYNTFSTMNANTGAVQNEPERERLNRGGETYVKLGDFVKAKEYYEELVEKFPDDYRGWWGLIYCNYIKNNLNEAPEAQKPLYVCKKCGFTINKWNEKCPSCGEYGVVTENYEVFQRKQMGELKQLLSILEKLAPKEIYVEYKKIVKHFLNIQAKRNADDAAAKEIVAATTRKTPLENKLVEAHVKIEKLKNRVDTESLGIDDIKRQYAHILRLVDQRQQIDTICASGVGVGVYNPKVEIVYNGGIGLEVSFYNSHAAMLERYKNELNEAKRGLRYIERCRYKELKKLVSKCEEELSPRADRAKEDIQKQCEMAIGSFRRAVEECRKSIIHITEREIPSIKREIEKCTKVLNTSHTEIQRFYLSVWHQWFELEPVSCDKSLSEWLSLEELC